METRNIMTTANSYGLGTMSGTPPTTRHLVGRCERLPLAFLVAAEVPA